MGIDNAVGLEHHQRAVGVLVRSAKFTWMCSIEELLGGILKTKLSFRRAFGSRIFEKKCLHSSLFKQNNIEMNQ